MSHSERIAWIRGHGVNYELSSIGRRCRSFRLFSSFDTKRISTMASSGSGYDLSAATFSPDGRIFQKRKMYKNKYGKPLKNFRVNPEKEEEPSIVEIKGIPTVREPRKRSSRKATRY